MILSWMAYASACAAVCAIAGACIDALLRHRLQHRRFVWVGTMSASLLLSVGVPAVASFSAPPAPLLAHEETSVTSVGHALPLSPATDWNRMTVVLWVSSSLLLAGALLSSHSRMRRRMRAFRETNVDGEQLLVSDDFGPALVGWWHPKIVLPVWALSLADAERRLVVSHELEHRRASDPVLAIGALIAVVLFPWNLALWWQLSRLQLAIEFDCDARVIRRLGADPFAYGNMLVEAQRFASHAHGPVLAMAPLRSALGKRVQALVARHTPSRWRSVGAVALAGGALSAFAVAPIPVLPIARVMSTAGAPNGETVATTIAAGAQTPRDLQANTKLNASVRRDSATSAPARTKQSARVQQSDTRSTVGRASGQVGAPIRGNRFPDSSSFGSVSRLEPARLVGGAGGNVNTPRDAMAAFRARYPNDTIVRSGFMGAEVRSRAELARVPNSR